jgi:hypothetical protein
MAFFMLSMKSLRQRAQANLLIDPADMVVGLSWLVFWGVV